jgi:hypothetical protein
MGLLTTLAVAVTAGLILPTHTPGVRYAEVTQTTLGSTVCVKDWTARIRPQASYTSALKRGQLAAWHYASQNPGQYEEDHLISLELGGVPYARLNLWPEPWSQARRDDRLENEWHRMLCRGALTLKQAQARELAYKRTHG